VESIEARLAGVVGETLRTRTGQAFRVLEVTERTVLYEVNGAPRAGRADAYRRAIEHVAAGHHLDGPLDLQVLDPSDRNVAYEWAVLRRLGVVSDSTLTLRFPREPESEDGTR
jgi:hypothetical protein